MPRVDVRKTPRTGVRRICAAVEVERQNLCLAESVLACMAIALDAEIGAHGRTADFAGVINLARKMIVGSIDRLDAISLNKNEKAQ